MKIIPEFYADAYVDSLTKSLETAFERICDEMHQRKRKAEETTVDIIQMKYISEAVGLGQASLIIQDQLRKDGLM